MLHMDHVRFGSKADIRSAKRNVHFEADIIKPAFAHFRRSRLPLRFDWDYSVCQRASCALPHGIVL
jgi:hypothetical protein